jgi:dTDP-4-amino-4,6-dideoxygalactose transaminase
MAASTTSTKMKVPFYGHARQYHNIKREIDDAFDAVMESAAYVMGPTLARFEKELARYFGMKHAVGLNSGTDALWLAFFALGIQPGDEVITTANTFFATAEAIWIAGAKLSSSIPTQSRTISTPRRLKPPSRRAPSASFPCTSTDIAPTWRPSALPPKSTSSGSSKTTPSPSTLTGHGFKQGELSDAVCTSFIIQKNLGTFGDGGALITNRPDIELAVRRMRNHGSLKRSVHSFGFNSRLDNLHAAFLSVKLKHVSKWTDQRRTWAKRYTDGLKGNSFRLPTELPGYRHVYHLYVIEHHKRDHLTQFLVDHGIDAKQHYPIAIHQQEGYPWGKLADLKPHIPNAEHNAAQCVSLPMFPELTAEEVDYSIAKLKEWAAQFGW